MSNFNMSAKISLKDEFTTTLRRIAKEQGTFKTKVSQVKKELKDTFGKRYRMTLDNSQAIKNMRQVKQGINNVHNAIKKQLLAHKQIRLALSIKDKATSTIKSVHSKLMILGRKVFSPVLKLKDQTSKIFSGLKTQLTSITGLLTTVAVGGGIAVGAFTKGALESGSMLERQQVAMDHFIGVNNSGKSQAEIKKMADTYLNDLRQNANVTPFETTEVVSAGARAINVASGDTSKAMDLVKLAEDMASLNPEKTLSDAMEALADLNVGETERMKEFGFKIDAEAVKKATGKDGQIDFSQLSNKSGISITEMFKGGAQKLSNTGQGLFSTIKGMFSTGMQDMGLKMLEGLKPIMTDIINFMNTNKPTLDKFFNGFAKGFAFTVKYAMVFGAFLGKMFGAMQPVFTALGSVFSEVMAIFNTKSEETSRGTGGYLKMVGAMALVLSNTINVMKGIIVTALPIVLDVASWVLGTLGNWFKIIGDTVSWLVNTIFMPLFPIISDVLQVAWSIIEPILEVMGKLITDLATVILPPLAQYFTSVFDDIRTVVQSAWDFLKPIFEGIATGLQAVGDGYNWAKGKVTGVVDGAKEFFGIGDKKAKKLAYGMPRVPRDNYPTLLHEGERVLTKREVSQGKGSGGNITIQKLADSIVVREESDIDKIAQKLVEKLTLARDNNGEVFG